MCVTEVIAWTSLEKGSGWVRRLVVVDSNWLCVTKCMQVWLGQILSPNGDSGLCLQFDFKSWKFPFLSFNIFKRSIYLYFMFISILFACIFVHHVYTMCTQARTRHQSDPWNWSDNQLWADMNAGNQTWVLWKMRRCSEISPRHNVSFSEVLLGDVHAARLSTNTKNN